MSGQWLVDSGQKDAEEVQSIKSAECRMQSIKSAECRVQKKCRVQNAECRVNVIFLALLEKTVR